MYSITVTDHFDAAHHLREYQGKCSRQHGHRWVVQVTVEGEPLDKLNMLIDFKYIKDRLKKYLDTLDHYDLNNITPWTAINPTAESVAEVIYRYMKAYLGELPIIPPRQIGVKLTKVRVYESPDCYAEYYE